MKAESISVIMSVYNETNSELESSINSILAQTYDRLEFIVIDDNPDNVRIRKFLESESDSRIKILYNHQNMGLVYSLNKALKNASGSIIARMDADDIAEKNRLEMEYLYLKKYNLDLVGTWIKLINTQNGELGALKFPTTSRGINHQIKYGGCLAHPTWLGKKELFSRLCGYRYIPYCEDYDFLLRAIKNGYKLGNVPQYGLNYRVREGGISLSNQNKQLVIRRFLSKQKSQIESIQIDKFIESKEFTREVHRLEAYEKAKKELKNHNKLAALKVITNKNLYVHLYEKYASLISRILYIEEYNENQNNKI